LNFWKRDVVCFWMMHHVALFEKGGKMAEADENDAESSRGNERKLHQ
jgi:hypothetical protein